jgi:hypothetical protein
MINYDLRETMGSNMFHSNYPNLDGLCVFKILNHLLEDKQIG